VAAIRSGYGIVTLTVVVWVLPPPVPVMVIVLLPVFAFLASVTVIVDVPEPEAAIELGLKLTFAPFSIPEADKATAEEKPLSAVLVIVEVPEWPGFTLIEVGDALMLKSGLGPVTVRLTVVVCVTLPPVPVTVIVYVPGVVVDPTVMVIVELPEPGAAIDVGLKPTVTPDGWPLADRPMAESKPPETAVVIVDVPLLPCATETEVGEAEIVKLGLADAGARALIRLAPFGLPQPLSKS